MPQRNTEKLNELIFTTLNTDVELLSFLGGAGKIRHANHYKKIDSYPCITYNIIGEEDDPFDEDIPAGISKSEVEIQIFTRGTSSKLADSIEDRIFEMLHGKSITNAFIKTFSIFRVFKTPLYEDEVQVFRIIVRYLIANTLK